MTAFLRSIAMAITIVTAISLPPAAGAVSIDRAHDAAPATVRRPKNSPQLRQDGDAVVVTQTLTVNNSRHALVTDAFRDRQTGQITLTYAVLQNRDYLVRSQKRIELTWRVPGAKATDPVRINGSILHLRTAELKAFAGELAQVMERPMAWR